MASNLREEVAECLPLYNSCKILLWKSQLVMSVVVLQFLQVVLKCVKHICTESFELCWRRERRLVITTVYLTRLELMAFCVTILHINTPCAFLAVNPFTRPPWVAEVIECIFNWLFVQRKHILGESCVWISNEQVS